MRMLLLGCCILALATLGTEAKRSKQYSLPGKYCGRSPKEIDGAVIYSANNALYASSGCVLKFRSDDDLFTSKRIMVHFAELNFTRCDGTRLKVYFDDDSYGTPDFTYDCNSVSPKVLYTDGKYLTLRLDKTGVSFKIILTVYREKTYCSEFDCGDDVCVDDDLFCDSVPNCLDGRDEFNCTVVEVQELGFSAMIGMVVVMLLVCGGCSALVYFVCRRRRRSSGTVLRTAPPPAVPHQQQPMLPAQQPTYPTQPGAYPTQPQYPPAQPGYPPAQPGYPPAQPGYPPAQPGYPPAQPGYPPAQPGYPPAQPAYGQAYPPPDPNAPPPPAYNDQVNYNSNQEKVQFS